MEVYGAPFLWLLQAEFWVVLGIVLITLDIFLGFGKTLLPIGIAALLLGVLLYSDSLQIFGQSGLFSSWRVVLICFACLSIVSVGLVKILFQRKEDTDINKY